LVIGNMQGCAQERRTSYFPVRKTSQNTQLHFVASTTSLKALTRLHHYKYKTILFNFGWTVTKSYLPANYLSDRLF